MYMCNALMYAINAASICDVCLGFCDFSDLSEMMMANGNDEPKWPVTSRVSYIQRKYTQDSEQTFADEGGLGGSTSI